MLLIIMMIADNHLADEGQAREPPDPPQRPQPRRRPDGPAPLRGNYWSIRPVITGQIDQ